MDSCIRKDFNGAVLIADHGKVNYLKYTGMANRREDIPFSTRTIFHIFSVTKTFTAALIMQLYEQGRVNLDSTISAYLPDYRGEAAHKVSIRNLLTYSSGRDLQEMRDFLEVYSNDLRSIDTFIAKYCSGKLVDTPGTKFNYSNGDFIILGKILEQLYGQPYETVLREKILQPLHMEHSGYLHHEDIIKGMAEGYAYCDTCTHRFYTPTNYYIDNLSAAGAMYSTPEDLLKFDQAIFHHTLLKKETVDLMLTAYPELGDVSLGFWVYPKKLGSVNTLFAERQGGGYGFHSNWVHLVDKDITLILLANTDAVDLNKMREDVLTAYLAK
ncbi:serine hydrolase domain-containing protein [Chitinophaga agrisoli]|nr:serine hydrolase domain-containing protein [Chitinophaga agrisoli]